MYRSIECILATFLSREKLKVLHVDCSDSYGGNDSSLSHSQFVSHVQKVDANCRQWCLESDTNENDHFLFENDRQFSIDISIPRLLFCHSASVDFLVSQQVSKYLSFLPVKQLLVGDWEFPTSRSKIFADKLLTMTEKRCLMTLFKSVASNSTAVHSTTMVSAQTEAPQKEWNGTAIDFLSSEFSIHRPELIQAIIHGMCLFPHSPGSMSASDLHFGLIRFIASLTAFGDNNALLVPMYGNSDLPQAFARAAAVEGALYILNCPLAKLKPELPEVLVIVTAPSQAQPVSVLHAVVGHKKGEDNLSAALAILPGATLTSPPVFMLTLPVGVSPPGCVLKHYFQFGDEQECFDNILHANDCLFSSRFRHTASHAHPFDIEDEIEAARIQFNKCMGLALDTPVPEKAPCDAESP